MKTPLKPREFAILFALDKYLRAHVARGPSYRELARACDLPSETTVWKSVKILIAAGLVTVEPGVGRSLRMTRAGQARLRRAAT